MNKGLTFLAGGITGVMLLVGINTWGGNKALDDVSEWLRKATGTEKSFTEKMKNRASELGDTFRGEESFSKKIRKTGDKAKDKAEDLLNDAKKSAGDTAEKITE